MSESFDTVIVGAGCDGLAAAILLAGRGRVLVVERAAEVGGLCRGLEFSPGYRGCGLLHDAGRLRPAAVERLALARHGLRRTKDETTVLADPEGDRLEYAADLPETDNFLERRRTGGAERHRAFRRRLAPVRRILADFCDRAPLDFVRPESVPPVEGLKRLAALRGLGARRMLELLRWPPMSVQDFLAENLDDPLLQAGLALPAIAGGFAGPRSPGTAFDFLLHDATYDGDVDGGAPAIAAALASRAREAGVEIRTECEVRRISVDDAGRVTGVVLANGRPVAARQVVAGGSPRQVFLELLPAGAVNLRTEQRAREIRMRGTTAFLILALERAPRLPSAAGNASRAVIAGDLTAVERAFDGVKYGELPETPVLDLRVAAGPGNGGVVSVAIHFVPYQSAAQRDPAAEDRLAARVAELIEAALPGLTETTVARCLQMPVDLEAEYSLEGGQLHRGEHALDQRLVRPFPECHDHSTPVKGLFLTGAGTHPGGGATCASGLLVADRITRTGGG